MKDLKYFCSHLFTSLSFDHAGRVRVCCNNYEVPTGEDLEPINVYSEDFDVKKAFNSDLHTRIRKNILNNKQDESCIRCWQTEDNGADSYRTIWNSTLASGYLRGIMLDSVNDDGEIDKPFTTFLDFTMGNKCNLVCRMCNLQNSNQWDLESDLLGLDIEGFESSTTLEVDKKFLSDEFFVKNFMHLKQVNFLGGEPLIIKEHYEFLKKCIKFGVAPKMILSYTTNLTVIKKELKDLWKCFRHVSVGVSLDAIGPLNDYIRYPSKWNVITKNLLKLSKFRNEVSMDIQIHSTFQLLNVLDWGELFDWTYSLSDLGVWRVPFPNWLTHPSYYDCRILSDELKQDAIDRITKSIESKSDTEWTDGEKQWLGILDSNLKTMQERLDEGLELDSRHKLQHYTKLLDMNRDQSITKINPKLAEFIYEKL